MRNQIPVPTSLADHSGQRIDRLIQHSGTKNAVVDPKHVGLNMLVVVGLGNPGLRYQGSRHNVGFSVVDVISEKWGIKLSERRSKAVVGKGTYLGRDVVLAKPRTFMNNSGEGVKYLLSRFSALPSDLLVIYDEMALPLGKLRLRPEGTHAGHNGIRSIIDIVGTIAFPRLRIGIGAPQVDGAISHVLGGFSKDQKKIIDDAVERAVEAATCLLKENIDVAMGRYN